MGGSRGLSIGEGLGGLAIGGGGEGLGGLAIGGGGEVLGGLAIGGSGEGKFEGQFALIVVNVVPCKP